MGIRQKSVLLYMVNLLSQVSDLPSVAPRAQTSFACFQNYALTWPMTYCIVKNGIRAYCALLTHQNYQGRPYWMILFHLH
jgi:hypothetical protein